MHTAAAPAIQIVRPLEGRVVAVTGAGSGIGRDIVRTFARAGAIPAALDIDAAALRALNDELGCHTGLCDVTDPASVTDAFATLERDLGGLDILVSNAGSGPQGPIGDISLADLRRSFDLNFFGHQLASQAALRIFRRQARGGAVLFNISNQSVNPGKHFGPYGIPKAAVMALMKQYALDHSHEGIRFNGVNAGRIRSGLMTDQMIADRAAARGITPKEYMSGNLLGVEVTSADVAETFLNLALMDKVNAAVLTVDGGAIATALR